MLRLTNKEWKDRFGKLPKVKKPQIYKIPKGVDSELEELLAHQMKCVGLPEFKRQYKFHPDREWKIDFFLNDWGIEVQGGGWNAGRHNRNPITMGKDYEKLNAATEMGIRILLYTGEQVKDGSAIIQIERIFK